MTPSRTEFAGLERLDAGDALSSDGFAFQSQNPLITDFLLKIGAILHKHDAHAAMADPATAATLTVSGSGGTIPAATTIYVQYTLNDAQGGETLPTAVESVTIPTTYTTPTGAPAFTVNYAAGAMLAGTPMYAVTVTDGHGGETALGPPVSVTINPTPAGTAEVVLSGLTAITNTASGSDTSAGWRLWRSVDGGNDWDYLTNGPYSTDGYTDDGSLPGDCSQAPPAVGTTGDTGSFTVTVPASGQPAGATFFNVYACTDGLFYSPSLLGTYPVADYGTTYTFTSLPLQAGRPPAKSTCIGGANQINPDTDILNWHWKQPIASSSALSAGVQGDVRVALDTGHPWIVLGATASGPSDWTDMLSILLGVGGHAHITDLEFAGASGVSVAVTNPTTGEALVTISGTDLTVSDGTTTETAVSNLEFTGATVSSSGAGEATVAVGVTPAQVAHAHRASAFSVTPNTWTKVPIDTTDFDTTSGMDTTTNHRYVCQAAGKFDVIATTAATGSYCFCSIYKNGTQVMLETHYGSGAHLSRAHERFQCSTSDYFEVWVYTDASAIDIDSTRPVTLSVVKL